MLAKLGRSRLSANLNQLAKAVAAKLGNPKELPGVCKMRETIACEMTKHLATLQVQQDQSTKARLVDIEALRQDTAASYREARDNLRETQETRQEKERRIRQARIDCFRGYASRSRETLSRDREQYRTIQDQPQETFAIMPHRPTGTGKSFIQSHER